MFMFRLARRRHLATVSAFHVLVFHFFDFVAILVETGLIRFHHLPEIGGNLRELIPTDLCATQAASAKRLDHVWTTNRAEEMRTLGRGYR